MRRPIGRLRGRGLALAASLFISACSNENPVATARPAGTAVLLSTQSFWPMTDSALSTVAISAIRVEQKAMRDAAEDAIQNQDRWFGPR